MRLSPDLLRILAGTLAGVSLSACGASPTTTPDTTPVVAVNDTSNAQTTPVTTTTTTVTVSNQSTPVTNGVSEESYPVPCGRG